jgi:hypothetical protein
MEDIKFKTDIVSKMSPDQLKVIADLKHLQSILNEEESIWEKIKGTGLECRAQSNEYEFWPIKVLDWILKNGYKAPEPKSYEEIAKELRDKKL